VWLTAINSSYGRLFPFLSVLNEMFLPKEFDWPGYHLKYFWLQAIENSTKSTLTKRVYYLHRSRYQEAVAVLWHTGSTMGPFLYGSLCLAPVIAMDKAAPKITFSLDNVFLNLGALKSEGSGQSLYAERRGTGCHGPGEQSRGRGALLTVMG
jgi:hypothetical protein